MFGNRDKREARETQAKTYEQLAAKCRQDAAKYRTQGAQAAKWADPSQTVYTDKAAARIGVRQAKDNTKHALENAAHFERAAHNLRKKWWQS